MKRFFLMFVPLFMMSTCVARYSSIGIDGKESVSMTKQTNQEDINVTPKTQVGVIKELAQEKMAKPIKKKSKKEKKPKKEKKTKKKKEPKVKKEKVEKKKVDTVGHDEKMQKLKAYEYAQDQFNRALEKFVRNSDTTHQDLSDLLKLLNLEISAISHLLSGPHANFSKIIVKKKQHKDKIKPAVARLHERAVVLSSAQVEATQPKLTKNEFLKAIRSQLKELNAIVQARVLVLSREIRSVPTHVSDKNKRMVMTVKPLN